MLYILLTDGEIYKTGQNANQKKYKESIYMSFVCCSLVIK